MGYHKSGLCAMGRTAHLYYMTYPLWEVTQFLSSSSISCTSASHKKNIKQPMIKMADTLDSIERQYYAENYDKAMRLAKDARDEMGREFLKKYPNADIDKFRFEVSVDKDLHVEKTIYYKFDERSSFNITSDTFLNNKERTKYPTINKKVVIGI